jgi:hypothetical protein
MDANLIKALLINAAYEGAVAVCGPLTDADGAKIEPDPLIQDAGLRKKGLCVYEEAKVQYAALLRAFEDKTGIWPDPKLAPVAPPAATPVAPASPPAAPASGSSAATVAGVAKAVSDVLSAVVPNPGSELPK